MSSVVKIVIVIVIVFVILSLTLNSLRSLVVTKFATTPAQAWIGMGIKSLRSLRPLRENINHPAIVTFPQKSTNLGRKVNPFSMEKSCKRVHFLWCTYHPDALYCLLSTTLLYIGTYSVYSVYSLQSENDRLLLDAIIYNIYFIYIINIINIFSQSQRSLKNGL